MSHQLRGKYSPEKPPKKPKKQSGALRLLTVLACLSGMIFLWTLYNAVANRLQLRQLRQELTQYTIVQTEGPIQPPSEIPTLPQIPATQTTEVTAPTEITAPAVPTILPQFQELSQRNRDLAGWLTVEGTRIDYPVMYSPDDPERYLHANFEKEYSFAGLPFIDAACEPDRGNRIIYAHNMMDGSMFRTLMKYQQKDYWEKHPTIQFSTLYEAQEYEVIAAFYDQVYQKTDKNFKFYQFYDTSDPDQFAEAMAWYGSKALYETGVAAQPGDRLLTLVTCAYHTDNGRFVVVARQK